MYPENETDISESNLSTVISGMDQPVCLLGGWAVYMTVNPRFSKKRGVNYLASRDIDLGFCMDPSWTVEELRQSQFSKSIGVLTEMKYYGLGSRFVQHYDLETKKPLGEEESKRRPKYEMFDLFVDLIVDKIHPGAEAMFGFCPVDEPILAQVFSSGLFAVSDYFGKKVVIPGPEALAAMKLNSVLNRTKDDKRKKDIADLYSLLWYSGVKTSELSQRVHRICGRQRISQTVSQFTDADYAGVANTLSTDVGEVQAVVGEIAK